MTIQTSWPVMPVLEVDFNALGSVPGCSRRKCLPALFGDWLLVPGQKVVLTDDEGNRCQGRVRSIRKGFASYYAEVHPHFSTWKNGP